MRVTVLYFGMLKEIFGECAVMELDSGADVAGVIAVHRGRATGFAWGSIAVAVNQEYARVSDVLNEGDEVALLPPVSGGCCAAEGLAKENIGRSGSLREYPTHCDEAAMNGAPAFGLWRERRWLKADSSLRSE